MMLPWRPAAIVLALSALAACGGEKNKESDQRTAVGEILPGSTSDAMLRYDGIRSQSPLAPTAESSGRARSSGGSAGPEANSDEAAPDQQGAPTTEAGASGPDLPVD